MDGSRALLSLCSDLAERLSGAGAPAHRVETAVQRVLQAAGAEGSVVASPTAVWLQVGERARVVRLHPGDVELATLTHLLRLVDRIAEGMSPTDAAEALVRLGRRAAPWPPWLERTAFVGTSASAAVLMGGGVQDVVVSAVAGAVAMAVIGGLAGSASWHPLRDVLLATVLGVLGAVASIAGASPMVVALSGAILVVPGLSLTTAIAEAAAGHWSSGSARLLGATMSMVQLAAGVSLGWWLVGSVERLWLPMPLPPAVVELVPLVAPACFAVLLRARRQDLAVIWLTAVLGWSVAGLAAGAAGAFAAATTVGALARGLGRLTRVPDLVLVLPGVLLLVPGTVGVIGFEHLLAHDVQEGVPAAMKALELAGALAAGLFAGQGAASGLDVLLGGRPPSAAVVPGPGLR